MKKIRQGKAIEVSGMSIIPIECILIDCNHTQLGFAMSIQCTPIGVIFDNGCKRWAVGVDGESTDLETLGVPD